MSPYNSGESARAAILARNSARPRPNLNEGDKVKTTFKASQANIERTVTKIYPSESNSQTGWLVDTIGDNGEPLLGLDSGWYEKCPSQVEFEL